MPALLLLPWVAFTGSANQTTLAALLAGAAISAAYALCERAALTRSATLWLCVFLFAGTSLLWCAMLGDVWFIAHVSAVAFTMIALCELAGKQRAWIVALCAVFAALSRFTMVLAIPVYVALMFVRGERSPRAWATFGAIVLASMWFWVWYNYARWGVWYDIGYTTWYHQDQAGSPSGSPFQLQYLRYELWSFLLQLPAFSAQFPYIVPGFSGVALTLTSPALIYALWARRPQRDVIAMWIATALTAIPNLLYYVNGFAQYAMRHALDFIPFLFVLMVLAAREKFTVWVRVLIAYSCAANLYGVWFWNVFVRANN